MNHTKVELLSPAGTYECFLAAIAGGADAVYLGLDKFGARANAGNLSNDELIKALDLAHINNKRIYLTVNTLFKDEEIEELRDFLYEPYIYGLDGVIVQDVGAMAYIHRIYPALPIHVSTQAAITAGAGAKYIKTLGVTRIVPARELSLNEIRKMKQETGLELECFIHGSMCYSYSGKCLLSSFIGGRSGNRGRCAQPCRLAYDGKYPLSLKDMCTIDILPELIGTGISSFKIEGRMKSSEYVYSVTRIYRKYIDKYYESKAYKVSDEDRRRLIALYTRSGNSDGYYFRHNGRKMITLSSPSYTTEKGEDSFDIKELIPSVDVNINCTIRCGQNAVISVTDGVRTATAETGIKAEKAVTRAVTGNEIIASLKKSGGTEFSVKNCTVDCDEGIFIPKSMLNEIRRTGLAAFREALVMPFHRNEPAAAGIPLANLLKEKKRGYEKVRVIASVLNKEQLMAVLDSDSDRVVIPMSIFDDCKKMISGIGGKEIFVSLPYVIREELKENSSKKIEAFVKNALSLYNISGFYVSNLESIEILTGIGGNFKIVADEFVYAYNNLAYDFYRQNGVDMTTVPVELNRRELIKRGIKGEELIVYGRVPVMISANCTYNTLYGCNSGDGGNMYLTDRKNEKLFVNRICGECTNIIYNSVRTCIVDETELFDGIHPSAVRFCFTDEDKACVSRILDTYYSIRNENGAASGGLVGKYTKGHINRGVE